MARPLKDIDPEVVKALASVGCSIEEIADQLDCSSRTIFRRFGTAIKKGHNRRNVSVRRAQFEVGVIKKNPTMLIWLGKQHLGQSDKNEQTGKDGQPFGPPPQLVVNFGRPDEDTDSTTPD